MSSSVIQTGGNSMTTASISELKANLSHYV